MPTEAQIALGAAGIVLLLAYIAYWNRFRDLQWIFLGLAIVGGLVGGGIAVNDQFDLNGEWFEEDPKAPNPPSQPKATTVVEMVQVPSFIAGTDYGDAVEALKDTGLNKVVVWEYSDTVPYKTVVRTEPQGGTELPRDSSVNLVLSLGPKPAPIETPDPPAQGTPDPTCDPTVEGNLC